MAESGQKWGPGDWGVVAMALLALAFLLGTLMYERRSPPDAPALQPTVKRVDYGVGVHSLCAMGDEHTERMASTETRLQEAIRHCRQSVNQASCRQEMTGQMWLDISQPIESMDEAENALGLARIDHHCNTGLIDRQIRLSRLLSDLRPLVGR